MKEYCYRLYPSQNLVSDLNYECVKNPFLYSLQRNNSSFWKNIDFSYYRNITKNNYLFLSIVDESSFKYLLNLYKIFFFPFKLHVLLTIVFSKNTLLRCIKCHIYCLYVSWPEILNNLSTTYKMKIWFLKYIILYNFTINNISVLYIDSDVVFIQNCLDKLLSVKKDLVLLQSQSSQVVGNAGIMYIV